MYWFRRPPYLRWAAAALLVITATWLDVRPQPTVLHPFAAVALTEGTVIENGMIEWRTIPANLLPDPGNPVEMVSRSVSAGEPLVPSAVSNSRIVAPEGWWTLETRLPRGAHPGQAVQLILLENETGEVPAAIPGMVVAAPVEDPLAFESLAGLIAVPAESATRVAAAVAEARVAVILGS
ncbi:MAG: hypothetical protein OEM40_06295 [Acidimicrobiia bacterium]|nr:hypothetical protein [Acidimicrobiia bacterium]